MPSPILIGRRLGQEEVLDGGIPVRRQLERLHRRSARQHRRQRHGYEPDNSGVPAYGRIRASRHHVSLDAFDLAEVGRRISPYAANGVDNWQAAEPFGALAGPIRCVRGTSGRSYYALNCLGGTGLILTIR